MTTKMVRVDAEVLLAILQEPNSELAQTLQRQALHVSEKLDDQAIYERLEDSVVDAIAASETSVELSTELAQSALSAMKAGSKPSHGGVTADRLRKRSLRALVALARRIKEQLVAEGASAISAHFEASEQAATEAKRRGLNLSAGYLYRQMQKRDL